MNSPTVHKLNHNSPQHYYFKRNRLRLKKPEEIQLVLDVMMIGNALEEVIWSRYDQTSSLAALYKKLKNSDDGDMGTACL